MRITTGMMTNTTLLHINRNMRNLDQIIRQIETTKRIGVPSDNPIVASRALKFRAGVIENEVFRNNVNSAQAWMNITDSALTNINSELLARINELLVTATTNTNKPIPEKRALLLQMESLFDELTSNINQTMAGRYVFSGLRTNEPPVFKAGNTRSFVITQNFNINDIIRTSTFQRVPRDGDQLMDTLVRQNVSIINLAFANITTYPGLRDPVFPADPARPWRQHVDNPAGIHIPGFAIRKVSIDDPQAYIPDVAIWPLNTATPPVPFDPDDPSTWVGINWDPPAHPNFDPGNEDTWDDYKPYFNRRDPSTWPVGSQGPLLHLVAETGELVMHNLTAQLFPRDGISVTYKRTGFSQGELNPAVYFESRELVDAAAGTIHAGDNIDRVYRLTQELRPSEGTANNVVAWPQSFDETAPDAWTGGWPPGQPTDGSGFLLNNPDTWPIGTIHPAVWPQGFNPNTPAAWSPWPPGQPTDGSGFLLNNPDTWPIGTVGTSPPPRWPAGFDPTDAGAWTGWPLAGPAGFLIHGPATWPVGTSHGSYIFNLFDPVDGEIIDFSDPASALRPNFPAGTVFDPAAGTLTIPASAFTTANNSVSITFSAINPQPQQPLPLPAPQLTHIKQDIRFTQVTLVRAHAANGVPIPLDQAEVNRSFSQQDQNLMMEFAANTHLAINTHASNVLTDKMFADFRRLFEFTTAIRFSTEDSLRQHYENFYSYSTRQPNPLSGDELTTAVREAVEFQQGKEESDARGAMYHVLNNMLQRIRIHQAQSNREQTVNGARMVRMELLENRHEADEVTLNDLKSSNEDTDMIRAIILRMSAEAQFMASLQANSGIVNMSLANFIRI